MAGINFDDLVPKKSGAVSFDDLVPQQPKARAGSPMEAVGLGLAGGQLPFGNVITSRLAAEATAPFLKQESEGWRDAASRLYDEAQAYTKATQEENPTATTIGNIAGIVSTLPAAFSKPVQGAGVIATPAKGLKSVGDFATKMVSVTPFKGGGVGSTIGNTLARAAGGAAVASPIGGLYSAGEADAGQRMEAMGEGARNAALIGAALPVAGAVVGGLGGAAIKGAKNIKSGISARLPEELDDAALAIKEQASRQYQKMRDAGAVFNPQATQNIQNEISQTLAKDGNLNPRLHDKVLAVYDDINQSLSKGAVGLEELDQWRQVLGDIAGNFSDKVNARKATLMIKSIDDVVEKVQPNDLLTGGVEAVDALRAGREAWARQSKFSAVADIVKNAGNDAYKLKRDLEKMLLNPKKHRGFSKAEMDALKTAARQTTGEGVLKALGKFGFDIGSSRGIGNTALPTIGGIAAGLSGGTGAGVLVPIAGTAARQGQKLLAFGKAEELLKVIEQGGKVTNQMIATLPQAEKNKFLKQVMQMPAAKASGLFKKKIKSLPTSENLNMPEIPTKNLMDKFSKIESVPLSSVRAGQSKMNWDDFNKGKHPEPLIKGYEDKPVAIKLRNGEYIIQDGHHRTVNEINKNKNAMEMYVIDAEKYDPVNAGRKSIKASKEEIDNLFNELNK